MIYAFQHHKVLSVSLQFEPLRDQLALDQIPSLSLSYIDITGVYMFCLPLNAFELN